MEFSRYHIRQRKALFLPMPETFEELRKLTKQALLEENPVLPFVVTGEEEYFQDNFLYSAIDNPTKLLEEAAVREASIIGKTGNALRCMAMWSAESGTGVLVHMERDRLLCAYLPILTRQAAQYEISLAARLKRIAVMKGTEELDRRFCVSKGNWQVSDLLAKLADYLDQ